MSEDERAIRALVENWMAATKAGDVEALLALIADDVVFMVPGTEPFGKQAFAAALAGLGQFKIEGRSEIRELQVVGDFAGRQGRPPVGLHADHPAQGGGRPLAAGARCQPADRAALRRALAPPAVDHAPARAGLRT